MMARTWKTSAVSQHGGPKPVQRADLAATTKGSTTLSSLQSRQPRQAPVRPSALLTSSPAQPAAVRGCPVSFDPRGGCINQRIKMSAQWQDVAKLVDDQGAALTPTNVAYAFYRLGCLFTFLSSQRRTALEASGLLERLLALAESKVSSFGPLEVTLALDGLARLKLQPATPFLDALAGQVGKFASQLQPAQLPLIFWAFASLNYCPVVAVLALLDDQVRRTSPQMTAQGVSLVLSSCAALKYQPEKGTLACLSAAMRRALPAFNRNEMASCLEAFKAFNYHPGYELLQGVARQAGLRLPAAAAQPETRVANNVVSAGSRSASPIAALRERGASAAERFLARQHDSGTLAAVTAAHGAAAAREVQRRTVEAVQNMREGLSQGLGSSIDDWLYEFGQRTSPEVQPALLAPLRQPAGYWRFGGIGQVSSQQVNV